MARRVPRDVRVLLGAASLLAGLLVVHTLTGTGGPAVDRFFDVWVYSAAPLLGGASILVRARRIRRERVAWTVLGLGLISWSLGNPVWVVVFHEAAASLADALYLPLYPAAIAFLVLITRARAPQAPASAWLDGASGALTVAAFGSAFVLPAFLAGSNATTLDAAVVMSYPLLDVVVCAVLVVLLTFLSWRPGRDLGALGLGFVLLGAGDVLYALSVAKPGSVSDTFSAPLWATAIVVLGWSAWLAPRTGGRNRAGTWMGLALPFVLFLSSLAVLVTAAERPVNQAAIWLAVASLLVAVARSAFTFRELRSLPETRRQARTDELTGLRNRRSFFSELHDAVATHPDRGAAVLMLDLDRFKELNDTMGHHAGDRLLAQLGPRLAGRLRPDDTIARLGGDEFAVLCPGATATQAAEVARRLQLSLEAPFALGDMLVHVDASVGIAIFPEDGTDAEGLLQRADVAMYQAKSAGTGVERYDADRDDHSRERLVLVGELRRSLERQGEVVLHYQPQIAVGTGRPLAVEALVRWSHPERGLLGPAAFLDAAEGAGLMRRLGRHVLREAVAQAARWRDEGTPICVAVNLSAGDLADACLVSEVEALLEEHALDPRWLKLEITEHAVMTQPERARATLQELRRLGCRLALDDFGVGHSSLAQLKRLPVDELKIDRAFVMGMEDDLDDAAIVRAAAGLGRDLRLDVVAEGVETEEAWALLSAAGCTSGQGFWLSRPLPADELATWLVERERSRFRAGSAAAGVRLRVEPVVLSGD